MADQTSRIRLFNTLGRTVQDFVPLEKGKVGLYCCGPTVYDYATIGNFRSFIFVDVLRRTLAAHGYQVRHVMNITDVGHLASNADEGEDKMVSGARREGTTVWEIAAFYTDHFFEDSKALNILRPHVVAKATDHINDMIDLISRLVDRGFTYIAGGNVFFDVARFERYGELGLLNRQRLRAGARITVDQTKRNPEDFGLWFTRSKFENQAMVWDSPWGVGYPGWHIECSAMAMRYLQEKLDIHCGGIDLIPVHHTNEIAQSEAAIGINSDSPEHWVKYWCHGEFLMVNGSKMSKSKGNWMTISQLQEQGYHALDFRFFVLGAHYRSHQNFTLRALEAARSARRGLVERISDLMVRVRTDGVALSPSWDLDHPVLYEVMTHAANDLAIPRVLASLWGLVKEGNGDPEDSLRVISTIDSILGLRLIELAMAECGNGKQVDGMIEKLVEQREKARRNKDFRRADEIRDELSQRNITLKDTLTGTEWFLS